MPPCPHPQARLRLLLLGFGESGFTVELQEPLHDRDTEDHGVGDERERCQTGVEGEVANQWRVGEVCR